MIRRQYPYIHPLNLEDMLSTLERPKIDEDDNYLFFMMQFPVWDAKELLSRPADVDFLLGRDYVVTVHDGVLKPLSRLFQACSDSEEERQKLLGRGANDAFYIIVDKLVDYIFPMLRKVDGNLRYIEDRIFSEDSRKIIRDIALVRRDIIALRRLIRHLVPIVDHLENTSHPIIREELEEYFGDILDHLRAARDIIDEDWEVISGLADTANMQISHQTNEVIRVLTVFSVIVLPFLVLPGIFGMNVKFPFDHEHPAALFVLIGLMLAFTLLMLKYFRRRKWL